MKLLIYNDAYDPHGGVELRTGRLIEGLRRYRPEWHISFLHHHPDAGAVEAQYGSDVELCHGTADSVVGRLRMLLKVLRTRSPDVVVACKGRGAVELMILRRWISWSGSTMLIQAAPIKLPGEGRVKNGARKAVARWTFPRLDGIVAVSRALRTELASVSGVPEDAIAVCYNPVLTRGFFQKKRERSNLVSELPVTGLRLCCVGRLHRQKGFDVMLDAMPRIVSEVPDAHLILVGDGPERRALEDQVQQLGLPNHVRFTGWLGNPHPLIMKSDVFVCPSRWEGLPSMLIEAMMLRVRIVSTDCPFGPDEILDEGKYGALVPVEDPDALADAILAGRDQRIDPVNRNHLKQFAMLRACERYANVIERVAKGADPQRSKTWAQ